MFDPRFDPRLKALAALLLAELNKHIPRIQTDVASGCRAVYLSHAFDSCIDLLLGYTDGTVKVAALPNRPVILFVEDRTDGRS